MIINQIVAGGGTTPTGTLKITINGGYDVTNYASVNVAVPTTAPTYYITKSVDMNGQLVPGSGFINLTGVTDLHRYILAYAYYGNMNMSTVNMSSLTQISGEAALFNTFAYSGVTSLDMSNVTQVTGSNACENMCYSCSLLTSVDLGSLVDINGFSDGFDGCVNLTSVNLGGATTISSAYSMFAACAGLLSIDLHNVTIIYYAESMFASCTSLATVNLSGVEEIQGSGVSSMFYGCTALTTMTWTSLNKLWAHALYDAYAYSGIQTLYFPALTTFDAGVDPLNDPDSDPFYYMLEGVDGCTVHFPAALQATIGNWPSVQSGFEGTNTTVLFDL